MAENKIDVLAVMQASADQLWRYRRDILAREEEEARAAVAELVERERVMREALTEIIAINIEADGVFRKRGGTRRGLSIETARAALARCGGAK